MENRGASNGRVVTAAGENLSARVDALSKEVSGLTNVIKITPESVTITSSRVSVNAAFELALNGGDVAVRAGRSIQERSSGNMVLQSGAQLDLAGSSIVKINAPSLVLNNGTSPVVTQNSLKSGTGNPTVLAP